MEILLDASALLAVVADEPESEIVIQYTKNAVIVSPDIVSFEVANALTKMMKKKVIDTKEKMIALMKNFQKIPIKTIEADFEKSLEIAWDYTIYAYDSIYLEMAKRLNLPLLTFDGGMRRIARELGITILGENDAGI
jgi:predicted nucleic acid-binding protein